MKRNAATRRRDKVIERDYREFIYLDAFCVKCGTMHMVQLAHIRGYAQGYIKPLPWATVPLCLPCHTLQETNRDFWHPLSVEQAQVQAALLFNKWEINQDIGDWLAQLTRFHTLINQEVAA